MKRLLVIIAVLFFLLAGLAIAGGHPSISVVTPTPYHTGDTLQVAGTINNDQANYPSINCSDGWGAVGPAFTIISSVDNGDGTTTNTWSFVLGASAGSTCTITLTYWTRPSNVHTVNTSFNVSAP